MSYNPAGYEGSRRNVEYDYGRNAAQNAYGRFLSQQRGSRDLSDRTRGFKRSYPNFGAQFNARGLSGAGVSSGVQDRSMRNYLGDFYRDYGRAQQDMIQNLQQFDIGQQNLDQWRANALADIEQRRAQDIANSASNIQYLRSILGGL